MRYGSHLGIILRGGGDVDVVPEPGHALAVTSSTRISNSSIAAAA